MLYYRHKVYYQSLIEVVKKINLILFEDINEDKKLQKINNLWQKSKNMRYAMTQQTSALNDVVEKICKALNKRKNIKQHDYYEIELAEDELKRLNYETQRLYINNNVLDNCFSTLKHETMYYPSRIRQIIEENPNNFDSLSEITHYYKDLYTILSMQAQSQLETNIRINNRLISYLKNLLIKLCTKERPIIIKETLNNLYNTYIIEYRSLELTEEQTNNLFTPLTSNLNCLVIRQIIREIGEVTNHRGCGVQAKKRIEHGIDVIITLSNNINFDFNNLE